MRFLSDPELYRLEMDMLFAKAWIVVAHETEIPDAGLRLVRRNLSVDPSTLGTSNLAIFL